MRSSIIKFCHWNLNGLAAHDFVIMPLIEAFTSTRNFDIICFSETFLDSSIDISDTRININGFFFERERELTIQVTLNVVMFVCTTKNIYPLSGELTYLIFKNVSC